MSVSQQQPEAPRSSGENPDWKRQLAEHLDAYRAKHPEAASPTSPGLNTLADSRASRIARSVASRYAAAPTYKELLLAAAQAEQAAAHAQAALADRVAQDARMARETLAQAQEQVTQGAGVLDANASGSALPGSSAPSQAEAGIPPSAAESGPAEDHLAAPAHSATPVMPRFASRSREMHLHQPVSEPEPSLEDLWASSLVESRELLPSKLIEFPRERVSSRRARPHLPEFQTYQPPPQPESAQLRIFEVQPEDVPGAEIAESGPVPASSESRADAPAQQSAPIQTEGRLAEGVRENPLPTSSSTAFGSAVREERNRTGAADPKLRISGAFPSAPPSRPFKGLEWAALSLDKEPSVSSRRQDVGIVDDASFLIDPASIDRRLMAFAVDFALVTAAFLAFLLVFAASTPHLPTGVTAIVLSGVVYGSLWLLYQALFFSLGGATAGMLYAHIALCTFDDQNPTRSALRRRLAAWWLSCLPLGIGFLWCLVDEDNLSWHDRMTRMYQRGY